MSDSPSPPPLRGADPRLQRRRPSDEELEREATISEDDITDAIAAFNRYAPPEAKGLLNAVEKPSAD